MTSPFDIAKVPTREALAAWLELEAALIEATPKGSPERKRLQVCAIASRPNDNEHVTTARRIARTLRDPEMRLEDILARVRSARHFRAVVRDTVTRLLGSPAEVQRPSIRQEYLDAMPLPHEGEPDFEVPRATDLEVPIPPRGLDGPRAADVIDNTEPGWMIPGADEVCVTVRTREGLFEVPTSGFGSTAKSSSATDGRLQSHQTDQREDYHPRSSVSGACPSVQHFHQTDR
jgi:hypothetical protein